MVHSEYGVRGGGGQYIEVVVSIERWWSLYIIEVVVSIERWWSLYRGGSQYIL